MDKVFAKQLVLSLLTDSVCVVVYDCSESIHEKGSINT